MSNQLNNKLTNITELSEEDLSEVAGGCHHKPYPKDNCKPRPKPNYPCYPYPPKCC